MIENNHDYLRSRATLAEIASKSWRFSISTLFRRKRLEIANSIPEARSTGCEELDAELRALGKDRIEAQIAEDQKRMKDFLINTAREFPDLLCIVSALLDEAEHAAASELVGCETCYGDYTWNEIAACSVGHFICYGCLTRSVQEILYGQGQNMVGAKSSIRCISAAASPACDACIPPEILARVISEDMLRAMEEKAATENLDRSGMNLIRCPFCSYAEVDELQPYRIREWAKICVMVVLLLFYVYTPASIILAFMFTFFSTYLLTLFLPRVSNAVVLDTVEFFSLHKHWHNAVRRIQLKRRGALFKCCNGRCKRESCIQCCKEWSAFHRCYEKEEDSVRVYVEKAMANAVKRTVGIRMNSTEDHLLTLNE